MFKFLRRYNKWILAVGGVLLMITFLIPQAIQQLSQQAGFRTGTVATINNGEKVSAVDLQNAQREMLFITKLANIGFPLLYVGSIEQPEHWYLLVREAEEAGLVETGAAVPMTDQSLAQFMSLAGERNPEFVRQTFAKLNAVSRMMALYVSGSPYSDLRMKRSARRLLHSVGAEFIVLEADPEKSTEAPTEEELIAHFEAHADDLAGEGEHGFGYKFPNRLKLEWLTISSDSVRQSAEQSEDFGPVAQRLHWRRNENGVFPPVEEGAPVPEEVRDHLLDKLTQNKLDEISKYVGDQLRLNRRGLPEKDGFTVLPDDWDQRKADFAKLADDLRQKFSIDLPEYQSRGDDWLTQKDLITLKGIGTARTDQFGAGVLTLGQLVDRLKEFGGDGVIPLQEGIAGPPLRDVSNNVYAFRITQTDPSRRPSSIEEVREQVVSDFKKSQHYRALADSIDEIEKEARRGGMLWTSLTYGIPVRRSGVLALHNPNLLRQYQPGQPIPSLPVSLPVIGNHRPTVEAIIEHSLTLPELTSASQMTTDQRIFTVSVEDHLCVMIVRLVNRIPLSQQIFEELIANGSLPTLIAQEETDEDETLHDTFGFEALAKRHNFIQDTAQSTTQPDESATADAS